MINTDKYEGHTPGPWVIGWPNSEGFLENVVFINGNGGETSEGYDSVWSYNPFFLTTASGKEISDELGVMLNHRAYGKSKDGEFDGGNTPLADVLLMTDAPLLLEFIQKIVKHWCKPNQCNQAFGKDVRQLMYEYGLITFNEETRRYEVKE